MGKTLVLGMGNTIRGDDGVGIKIIEALKGQLDSSAVEIKQTHESGINLLDKIAGYEKVIIIDSIKSESGMIGDIYRLNPLWYRKVYRCLLTTENRFPVKEFGRKLSPKKIFLKERQVTENEKNNIGFCYYPINIYKPFRMRAADYRRRGWSFCCLCGK